MGRACGGLRLLNSYWVAQDAMYKYYECILIDPMHKAVRRDARINWICQPVHKHRELRGLTAAGRKGRGLNVRSHGASMQSSFSSPGDDKRRHWAAVCCARGASRSGRNRSAVPSARSSAKKQSTGNLFAPTNIGGGERK